MAFIPTCRDLQIRDTYDDFDAKKEREMGVVAKVKKVLFRQPVRTVHRELGNRHIQRIRWVCILRTGTPAMLTG